jgi:Tfp pilus assembly protein PilO
MSKLKLPDIKLGQSMNVREKIFSGIIAVVILIFFINLFWTPQSEMIEVERSALENVEMEMDAIKRLIDSAKSQMSIQRSVPQRKARVDEKVKRLLERKVVDPLSEIHSTVGYLSSKKFSRSVKVDDVNIGEMAERDNYYAVPIHIELTSRYGALVQYFAKLENINRPLVIKGFDLDRGGEEGIIDCAVDVELYIVKR